MSVYNSHPGWEILFNGDRIMHVYQPNDGGVGNGPQEGFLAFCMEDAHMKAWADM